MNAIPIFVLVAVFNNMYPVTSEVPRRLMVTLVVYFIVLVNVARGLREVGAVYLDLMRSYAASDITILRKVRVPHAVPYLFIALKIAAPASVITAFVSEYFGGLQNGLGSRIVSNIALSNNAEAWAYVLGACLLGLAFFLAAVALEGVATPGGLGAANAIGHDVGRTAGSSGRRPGGKGARMREKRLRFCAAGVLALALVAAACSSDDEAAVATGGGGARRRRRAARGRTR